MLGERETKLGAVETWQHAQACADLFRRNRDRIEGVLVCLPNFGDEKGVADVLRLSALDVPVLVQACPDDLDQFNVQRRRDAFCGKISVCNNLRQYGIPFTLTERHTIGLNTAEFKQELANFVAVCRVVRGMAIDGERGLSLRELTTTLGHPELFVPALALLAIVACIVIYRFKPPALSLVSGATAVALLASPHTMYYDGGLALLGIVAISRGRLTLVVGFLAAGLLFVPAPVSPLVLGSLFLCGLGLACLTDLPSGKTAEPAFPSSLPLFPDEVRGS